MSSDCTELHWPASVGMKSREAVGFQSSSKVPVPDIEQRGKEYNFTVEEHRKEHKAGSNIVF